VTGSPSETIAGDPSATAWGVATTIPGTFSTSPDTRAFCPLSPSGAILRIHGSSSTPRGMAPGRHKSASDPIGPASPQSGRCQGAGSRRRRPDRERRHSGGRGRHPRLCCGRATGRPAIMGIAGLQDRRINTRQPAGRPWGSIRGQCASGTWQFVLPPELAAQLVKGIIDDVLIVVTFGHEAGLTLMIPGIRPSPGLAVTTWQRRRGTCEMQSTQSDHDRPAVLTDPRPGNTLRRRCLGRGLISHRYTVRQRMRVSNGWIPVLSDREPTSGKPDQAP
jgi:hypothetical protein